MERGAGASRNALLWIPDNDSRQTRRGSQFTRVGQNVSTVDSGIVSSSLRAQLEQGARSCSGRTRFGADGWQEVLHSWHRQTVEPDSVPAIVGWDWTVS
jgi:hypothetical protein